MNTQSLATRFGIEWASLSSTLAGAGLDAAGIEAVRTIPARINGRLTRALGRVRINAATRLPTSIEISAQLATLGQSDEIATVVLHEVAHLAANIELARTGQRDDAHGAVWQRFAAALGVPLSTTLNVSYDTPLKTVAVCDACGHELKKTRRLSQKKRYTHRRCGGTFTHC